MLVAQLFCNARIILAENTLIQQWQDDCASVVGDLPSSMISTERILAGYREKQLSYRL